MAEQEAPPAVYEVVDKEQSDSQREAAYSQLALATTNQESLYATSETAKHHAPEAETQPGISKNHWLSILLSLAAASAVVTLACLIAAAVEIEKLKKATRDLQQPSAKDQTSDFSLLQLNRSLSIQLANIVDTQTGFSIQLQQLNGTLSLFKSLQSGQSYFSPTTSCAGLPPSSPSGYYWVRASNGSTVHVYCDMTRSCGNVTGGWMRVFELDVTDNTQSCPSDLGMHHNGNSSTCRRTESIEGCSSITISIPHPYSMICGRIIANQVGSTNAFAQNKDSRVAGINASIDTAYVDGVSLTHGCPRRHIWTFAAGLAERVEI